MSELAHAPDRRGRIAARLARLRAAATDPESLRAWSVIANDGIIATAGILEGFAGAGAGHATLVTAATSATIAGMLSAGGSEWAEAAAQREGELSAAAEEAADLARQPEVERAELIAYYEGKGLSAGLALEVATELMARDALDAQLESEHGILEVTSRADVVRAGIGGAIAYGIGALIPLVITLMAPVEAEPWLILVAAIVSLTLTSIVGARTGHMNLPRTLRRTLTVGVSTLVVSYLVGRMIF
jgi:VIT1/CCC1 family predicted Fe2+/Mn2+ transporter